MVGQFHRVVRHRVVEMNKAAPRKTKIVATIGPASRDPKTLDLLLKAGMDCARLNFSHGTLEEHGEVIRTLRQLTEEQQRPLAIMQDVGGIKLRIGNLKESMRVERGREVYLAPEGSSRRPDVVPFPHPEILQRLKPGDLIYISGRKRFAWKLSMRGGRRLRPESDSGERCLLSRE